MASVNKVFILGHLGRDPELRYTQDGMAFATLSVATSVAWKDKTTGEKKEETEWHRVTLRERMAEVAGEYLKKGSQVHIEGRLRTRKWTDKENIERYTTEIIGSSMQLLGAPRGEGDARPAQNSAPARQAKPATQQPSGNGFDDFDSDIPFANPYRGRWSYVV